MGVRAWLETREFMLLVSANKLKCAQSSAEGVATVWFTIDIERHYRVYC